jgi:predicted hotdog family 3-hydroxylacyl-ACP dehydratase
MNREKERKGEGERGFFEACLDVLPHGEELRVIDRVLFYGKRGEILCRARGNKPISMQIGGELNTSSAIEYIAQAGAIGRIIQLKLADQGLRKFGAIVKINNLKKNVSSIGLERPLLVYAKFKMVLTNVTEVSGHIRDSESHTEYASASFNVIEF